MSVTRRHFLQFLSVTTSATAMGVFSPLNSLAFAEETPFTMIPLPYNYKALEPYIDGETMQFHYGKHYASYTKNLNTAINQYPQLKSQSIDNLLANLKQIPSDIKMTVRNNGGGYANHTLFWQIMSPDGGGEPKGEIASAIQKTFGSFEAFQDQFTQAGSSRFGSGWVWLVLNKKGQLEIMTTQNQDSPLSKGFYPLMGNDVWEHAYYLKYRNNRGEYLKQWWNVVNWDEVNRRYLTVINKK